MSTYRDKYALIAVAALSLATPFAAYAEQDLAAMAHQIQELKRQVERLEQQYQEKTAQAAATTGQDDSQPAPVDFYGSITVEAAAGSDHSGENSSDIRLDEVVLGLDFSFNEIISGSFIALHEDDDTDKWEVDEAFFTVGNSEKYPLYLSAGRMYVPFGSYTTHLLSDPLTLELGETREAAVQLGFDNNNWYGSGYVFNGDLDARGGDKIKNYGFNVGYAAQNKNSSFDIGLGWINHLGDADNLESAIAGGEVKNHIAAPAVHGVYRTDGWCFHVEYVSATKPFQRDELAWKNDGATPRAYHLEVGYDFVALGRESKAALAWQGTEELSDALHLPQRKWLVGLNTTLYQNLSLALEYSHATDYSTSDGGTSTDGDAVTMQMAVSF